MTNRAPVLLSPCVLVRCCLRWQHGQTNKRQSPSLDNEWNDLWRVCTNKERKNSKGRMAPRPPRRRRRMRTFNAGCWNRGGTRIRQFFKNNFVGVEKCYGLNGLEVWFLLRVQEVPGSTPGWALYESSVIVSCSNTCWACCNTQLTYSSGTYIAHNLTQWVRL